MNRQLLFTLLLTASVITLSLSTQAVATDSPDYVEVAKSRLAELDKTDMGETWFFTITTHTDEEVLIARNNPVNEKGKRRELVSVNGELPTADRLKEWEDQQAKRIKEEDENDGKGSRNNFGDMVDLSTLKFEEISNGQAVLSYTPVLDGLEKASDKLDGTLKLNADTHLIEEINLVNTGKISPAFSVSMTTFHMTFQFSPVDGETLPSRMHTSIEGKAGFLKKFKTDTKAIFSDFRRIPHAQSN